MSDLLKQAIADAKAVRATALSNAKAALEEHFAPRLQSMLSTKLQQEVAGAEDEINLEEPAPADHADAAQDAAQADAMAAGGGIAPPAPAPAPAPADCGDGGDVAAGGDGGDVAAGGDGGDVAAGGDMAPVDEEEGMPNSPDGYSALGEAKKASSNYKTKTKGHKTINKGQEIKDATKLSTTGGLKSAAGSHKASPDYKKTTAGSKTEDPQGQGNEVSKGGYDNDTAALKENEGGPDALPIDEASLDEILKELQAQVDMDEGMDSLGDATNMPADGAQDKNAMQPHADDEVGDLEEIDLNELLSDAGDETEVSEGIEDLKNHQKKHADDADDGKTVKENISLKKELAEYRSAVVYLRDRINEVNLLNAKLLYTNKLFKQASLNNAQKLKVIESFDLTKSVREAKLVYATLAESFNFGGKKTVAPAPKKVVSQTVKTITEGLASKPVASTKPTKTAVLTEGAEMANRFKKLAGIRS